MKIDGREISLPVVSKISFKKLIDVFEEQAKTGNKYASSYAKDMLALLEKSPELNEGFEDRSILKKYKKKIDLLMQSVFPEALTLNEIKGATPPFEWEPFYASQRLNNILDSAGEGFSLKMEDINDDEIYIISCAMIMAIYFRKPIDISRPFIFEVPNKVTGKKRHYKMTMNADLVEFFPTDKSIMITDEDHKELIDNFGNVNIWKKKFPPNSWEMHGIVIFSMVDVSIDHSVTNITSLLLDGTYSMDAVESYLGELMNIKNIKVGYTPYANGSFLSNPKKEMKSIVMGDNENSLDCKSGMCTYTFHQLLESKRPIAISDVDLFAERSKTKFAYHLQKNGAKSYIIAPLLYEGELCGFFEVSSPDKYAINSFSLIKMEQVLPTISMAAKRFTDEKKNKIEAIIQEEFTSIHPSVKWRFEEEAYKILATENEQESAEPKDIIFSDVYPLFGQMDIRGSSTKRNNAVKADLLLQLKEVKQVFKKAKKHQDLPLFDELTFKISEFEGKLKKAIKTSSESEILDFLQAHVYPIFNYLSEQDEEVAGIIEKFTSKLDPDMHMIYKERKDFDESIGQINTILANYLDDRQEEAQKMFPHYFERYKTDGVEYNMYIGQSITNERTFNPLYLQNLRLWQLIVSCELELEFHRLKHTLKTPLEIASLLLVYSTSMSIHFRVDEKKFDVEGAYNARYEIIKKRIDKAYIYGTKERLTQPGKIALVYNNDKDAVEYERYIQYLMGKGMIKKNSIERLILEDLPGATGLKALRFTINFDAQKSDEVSLDEIMAAIDSKDQS